MTVNDLWNLLSCHGPHETVVIDATGLRIGRHDHIDVPLAPAREIFKNGCGEIIGTSALIPDFERDGTIVMDGRSA